MTSDWRTGTRSERYEWRLLDRATLAPCGNLDEVVAGSGKLAGSLHADVRWQGSLTWLGQSAPDWDARLVQPWIIINDIHKYPLCPPCRTAVKDEERNPDGSTRCDVTLTDIGYRVGMARTTDTLSLPAGTVITDRIEALLRDISMPRLAITPSTATLRTPKTWDGGTPILRVVNDLAEAAGYWGVHADLSGAIVGAPYMPPGQRSSSWRFEPGANAIIAPNRKRTRDDLAVPNRLTGVTPDGSLRKVVLLDDIDPGSPYTSAKRGFVDERVEIEASNAAALQTSTQRRLLSMTRMTTTHQTTHRWLPEVTLSSTVEMLTEVGWLRCSVERQELTMVTGLQVASVWREVGQ